MTGSRYLVVFGAAVALSACGGLPAPQAVQKRLELKGFASCKELETYIEDTAVLEMRSRLEQQKQGYNGVGLRGEVENSSPTAMDATAAGSAAPPSGPAAYTTTNTQVAGVDEADFVKNDGTRIFVLSGNQLQISRSWPAAELSRVSRMTIEGWPREMFLDDKNRLVIFSNIWHRYPLEAEPAGGAAISDAAICSSMRCGYYGSNAVKLTVIDVADIASPKVTAQYYLPGGYASSRRIGSSVRVVLNDHFRWPKDVRWYPEYDQALYSDRGRLSSEIDHLISQNEKLIRAQSLDAWLPPSKRRDLDGNVVDLPYECGDFHRSNAPMKLGLVTVATLNLDNADAPPARTSVVAQSGEIYASTQHLYIASRHWWWWPEPGQTDHTYIHKFDITHPDRAVYVASGGVDGHIVDQFSMDEHNGYFRLATTIQTRIDDATQWFGRMDTTNRVTVMGENEGRLAVLGQSEDVAKGERIFSSRFIGDRGFVVTFRQVDPLFTFDMSDPLAPRRVGELKIPGFSTYLHPVDANHLLAIGTHISETNDWRSRAIKLTLFDVSDFANPKEKFTHLLGTSSASSEAQVDHRAFNYFPEKKLLAIPFVDYRWDSTQYDYWSYFTSELRVFHVDTAAGFTPRGAMTMKDVYQTPSMPSWYYYWSPQIRRSVMADDFVYAISDAGIRVANVTALSTPLATVKFEQSAEQ